MSKPPSVPFKPDIPRRVVDIPGAPRRRFGEPGEQPSAGVAAAAGVSEHSRKLIVGREISLSGEISACDHPVVEGRIEAKISDCRTIEVLEGGVFQGSAQIEDANIPGGPRRRFGEPGEQPSAGVAAAAGVSEHSRKLIVGREISLSGEISACDHLVVEGRIEAKISDCRTIEVMEGGVFKGSAQIEEAYIAGRFEGELSVKGRLRLRGPCVVSGTLRSGELAVEAGCRVIGTMAPLEPTSVTPNPAAPQLVRAA